MFHIAAFYRFVKLCEPEAVRPALIDICHANGVKGTILLAHEGINGTIAGSATGVECVLMHLRSYDEFSGLEAKHATSEADPFLRLKVRLKREIVRLGVGDVDTTGNTGVHVPPHQWNELISEPDVVVIDTRNAYEVAIGTFVGAAEPKTRSFTEFPAWIAELSGVDRDTKIAMFCTGGIRCEKATAYLREQGFENVFQLEGGILKYLESVPAGESMWEGECYVFDRRVSVGHGLVPGDMEVCPNCNTVVADEDRNQNGYTRAVMCPACAETITEERRQRFAERQRQIDLAAARGTSHLGRVT